MDYVYRACGRVPHVQILASQKRLNIIFGYRAGKPVNTTLPAGIRCNGIREYRLSLLSNFHAQPENTIYVHNCAITPVFRCYYGSLFASAQRLLPQRVLALSLFPGCQDLERCLTIERKYREKLQLESCQTDHQQSGIFKGILQSKEVRAGEQSPSISGDPRRGGSSSCQWAGEILLRL